MRNRTLTTACLVFVCICALSTTAWGQQDPPTQFPPAGYPGFPTLAADDGRFVAIAQGLSTLGVPAVSGLNFSVCVPDSETNLDLWVFDGETTNTIATGSFWDLTRNPQTNNDAFEYNLYPDKDLVGNLTGQLENIDAATLADNDWDNFITRPLDAAALDAPNNRYCYHLEAVYMAPSGLNQANRIKLASNGTIFLLPGSTAGFVGLGDIPFIDLEPDDFPGRDTTYDGTFDFNVDVPNGGTACSLSIWDGDTDLTGDVDDTNSPNPIASLPFDTSPNTLDEGANPGDPADDPAVPIPNTTFSGAPTITIKGPADSYTYFNDNPSGNQEWERNKIISLDAACPAPPGDEDQQVAGIDSGIHTVSFANLDGENMIFLATEDADIVSGQADCLVIIDEEGLDNDFKTVEAAAKVLDEEPDDLINDQGTRTDPLFGDVSVPTEEGNPPLLWNDLCADPDNADACKVLLPTGQVNDWGWYALPETIVYFGGRPDGCPSDSQDWFEGFQAGTLEQECLDKIRDVVPLDNQKLKQLVGRTCQAIVYDSDISINYNPLNANLQGGRQGNFRIEILDYEVPGSLDENKSDTSLIALWVNVLEPSTAGATPISFPPQQDPPDAVEITTIAFGSYQYVIAECDTCTTMWVSADGDDKGTDEAVDPVVDMVEMIPYSGLNHPDLPSSGFYFLTTTVDLNGRRVVVWSDTGGSYTIKY